MARDLTIFTWNVDKKDLLSLIENHYNWEEDSIIGWLSEIPTPTPSSNSKYQIIRPHIALDELRLSNHGCFIVSNDIKVLNNDQKVTNRLFATFFKLTKHQDIILPFVGLHLVDKWSVGEQQNRISNFEQQYFQIKSDWTGAFNIKQIVLGDFNAGLHETLMTHENRLASCQTQYIVNKAPVIIKDDTPLNLRRYSVAREFSGNPLGSHRYTKSKTHAWHFYDQILLASESLKSYKKTSFKVVTKLGGISLVKKSDSIYSNLDFTKQHSDHLPIELKLEI